MSLRCERAVLAQTGDRCRATDGSPCEAGMMSQGMDWRFNALRLREVGMIKSNPNRIISEGTDWRFFNELKRELKS